MQEDHPAWYASPFDIDPPREHGVPSRVEFNALKERVEDVVTLLGRVCELLDRQKNG